MTVEIRVQVESRVALAEGRAFADVGPYVRTSGVVHFRIDPSAPAYRAVVDLPLAPVDADGRVAFAADFVMLSPLDLARGNRCILFDVINRGNVRALQFFNDAQPTNAPTNDEHAGNGFLMRRGYTLVAAAWQGDILPGVERMSMCLPVARGEHAPVTGLVRSEFIADREGVVCVPLSGNDFTHSYPAASLETHTARFSQRPYAHESRQTIAPQSWQFAAVDSNGRATDSAVHCHFAAGFRPGWIYELIYTARDPLVLGLGFAAVRDFISFLRYGDHDAVGMANPLRTNGMAIERVYGWGRSQSGRFLRELVYRGWNEDSAARRVFDGVHAHVTGAGRVTLNYRFAQPGRYPRQHEDHLVASDQFPFAYGLTTDPFTARADAILKRPASDPKVIHSQTAAEYWQRRGSLVHTDAFGADLVEHPLARIYFLASSQHFAPPGGKAEAGAHRHRSNPLDTAPILRALLDALHAWCALGIEPPPSRPPRRAEGTLLPANAYAAAFPRIPGVAPPGAANRLFRIDYGAELEAGRFALEPPAEHAAEEYAVLVPAADGDGNDLAGVRTPQLAVPIATYTGWNFRAAGSTDALYSIVGSYLPFATTAAERAASDDSRPALDQRYRSRYDYIAQVAVAAQRLLTERLLLPEDADRYLRDAIDAAAFFSE